MKEEYIAPQLDITNFEVKLMLTSSVGDNATPIVPGEEKIY